MENPKDGGAWRAVVHGIAEGWTWLSDFIFTFHFHAVEKEMAAHSCSCLENSRDGGAWWAAVYGVAQSRTRLKRLSSSSSSSDTSIKINFKNIGVDTMSEKGILATSGGGVTSGSFGNTREEERWLKGRLQRNGQWSGRATFWQCPGGGNSLTSWEQLAVLVIQYTKPPWITPETDLKVSGHISHI